MERTSIAKMSIYILGKEEESDKIEAVLQWIRTNLSINKIYSYKRSLEWITKDQKAKEKFMEYLSKKAQEEQLIISK